MRAISCVAAFVTSAALTVFVVPAQAGPCSAKIAQFEAAVRKSAGNPFAGPMSNQTVGAQIGHETARSALKRAKAKALASFNAALARAKRLNARGDASCSRALARARDMYSLPSSKQPLPKTPLKLPKARLKRHGQNS
jgi:hypothetical protein